MASLVLLGACQKAPTASAPPPAKVTASVPLRRTILDWDEFVGRVTPIDEVEVRAQVTGFLDSFHFTDGQMVNKGDLLFVIDPRPFEAAVDQAKAGVLEAGGLLTQARAQVAQSKAQLSQAKANQTKTRLDVERFKPLAQEQAITAQELDNAEQADLAARAEVDAAAARIETSQAAVAAAEAGVEAARARLQAAELNRGFTRITAPIAGRASRRLVSRGNLISGGTAQATLLTTIVSLDPIHVYFEADERSYLKYVRLARSGQRPSSREVRNPVEIGLADETGFPRRGEMDFVENRLDVNTSTIQGRARFANRDGSLTPGLFVRLRINGSGQYPALLIPDAAVGTNQGQKFVFVVNGRQEAELRPVTLGPMSDGLRVVREGLQDGDQVVVSGVQRIRPGAKLKVELKPITAAAVTQ